jgi:hypothetical protein
MILLTEFRLPRNSDSFELLNCAVRWLSPRKRRLWAAACCRLVWHLVPEGPCRQAVETAERFADGQVSARKLARARRAAKEVYQVRGGELATPESSPRYQAAIACADVAMAESRWNGIGAMRVVLATCAAAEEALLAAFDVAERASLATPSCDLLPAEGNPAGVISTPVMPWMGGAMKRREAGMQAHFNVELAQAEVLSDLLGSHIRPNSVDPVLLAWDGGKVAKLAAAIYDERNWFALPILADALEEAGCTTAELIAHLREPRRHVPGCWALDLLLGLR